MHKFAQAGALATLLLVGSAVAVSCTSDRNSAPAIKARLVTDVLPADFPLPRDARVVYESRENGSALVFFASDVPMPDLRALMLRQLPMADWRVDGCVSTQQPFRLEAIDASMSDAAVTIAIGYIPNVKPEVQKPYSFYVLYREVAVPATSSPTSC